LTEENGCGTIVSRIWTATDNCNNTSQQTQTITISGDFDISITPSQPNICVNEPIQFSVISDETPISYQWSADQGSFDDPNGAAPLYTGTVAGNINVNIIVTTASGCIGVASTNITMNATPNGQVFANGPLCKGENITLFASGGNTYQWSGPDGFTADIQNPVIPNSASDNAGDYSVTITNIQGCEFTGAVNVSVNDRISADYSAVHADCENLGSIVLGVIGGTGNYTFTWDPTNGTSNNQPYIREGLQPDIYNVTVTDDGGCSTTINNILIDDRCANGECVAEAGNLTIEDESLCAGDANNSITATPNGNMIVPPGFEVIYILTETQGNNLVVVDTSSMPDFVWDETGNYTIHTLVYDPATLDLDFIDFENTSVFDINSLLLQGGGEICGSLDLSGANAEVIEVDVTVTANEPDNCSTGSGHIELTPIDFAYSWNDGGSGANRDDLDAGIYQITVTDNNGCNTVIDLEIRDTCICILPTVAAVNTLESSCGFSNGSGEVMVDGNPLDYTYAWSSQAGTPNAVGNRRTDLPAGIYTVTITFPLVSDCNIVETFAIGNIDGPKLDSLTTTPATCSAPDGTVILYPDTYNYVWVDGATPSPSNIRTDLKPGKHNIVVINPLAPQCPDIISIEIDSINEMTLVADILSAPQCGIADGEVTINVENNPAGSFTYIWSDDATANQATRNGLAQGDYSVTVMDGASTGCESILEFTLDEQAVGATLTLDPIIEIECYGERAELIYDIIYDNNFTQPASIYITNENGASFPADNLIAGNYSIEFNDANGCRGAYAEFTVTEPAQLIVTSTITNIECATPGRIDLEVSGGTGNYTYQWAPGNSTAENLITNEERLYIVTVSDDQGCSKVLFGQYVANNCETTDCPPDPEVNNIIVEQANCGQSDGSVFIEMVGGNAGDFIFTWTPDVPNSGNSAVNLPTGRYEVRIQHAANLDCPSFTQIVNVGTVDGPEAVVVFSAPATCISADGSIVLSPTSYDYIWDDSLSGYSRNDLTAGPHVVTITDPDNGCTNTLEVTVEEQNDLTATITVIEEPSCGESNGVATINTAGGSGTYDYLGWGAGPSRSDLEAGIPYSIKVVDRLSGCEVIVDLTLENDVAGATINIDPIAMVSCPGASDGTVIYDIILDPGFAEPAVETIRRNNISYSNGTLTPGDYVIIVVDANGCFAASAPFEVLEPEAINVSFAAENKTCDNNGNETLGTVILEVTGGTGTYNYNWNHLPGFDNPQNSTGLQDTVYAVTVTDGNGCSTIVNNIVVGDDCQPCEAPVLANVVTMDASCGEANGEVTINLQGNPANYLYTWSLGGNNGNTATGLIANAYSVTISEPDCNETLVVNFSIGNTDGPIATIIETTPANCAANDGTAILSPNTFNYDWGFGIMGDSPSNLTAGTYVVTVTETGNPCINIISVVIDAVSNLNIAAQIDNQPNCGVADGIVTMTATNAANPVTYQWSDGFTGTTQDNLAAQQYSITATDANGCTAETLFSLINNTPAATITINTVNNNTCAGTNNGEVVYATDYAAGFMQPANIEILNIDDVAQANGQLAPGSYCIVVSDATGCLAGESCFEIVSPENLSVQITVTDADCNNGGGAITLDVSGGTQGYTYNWADVNDNSASRTGLAAGVTYAVTITDANGCITIQDGISIENTCTDCETPVITSSQIENASCGEDNGSINITILGDLVDYIIEWSTGDNDVTTIDDLGVGIYTVTITNTGCPASEIFDYTITNTDGPIATVDSTTPATCNAADGTATLTPANYLYNWEGPRTGATQNDLATGSYDVTVVDPATGCDNIITVVIAEESNLDVEIIVNGQPSCGVANGSIETVVTGGSGDYNYSIGKVRTDLAAGTYISIVTDNQTGCTARDTIGLINSVASATITIDPVVSVSCIGANDGAAIYTIVKDAGFVENERIEIQSPGNNAGPHQDGQLSPGIYCVVVFDGNDCLAAQACFEVVSPEVLSVSSTITNINCTQDGNITLSVSGGTSPYNYNWSNGNNTVNFIDVNIADDYAVTITDANGCSMVVTNMVVEDDCIPCDDPQIIGEIITDANCNEANGSITITMQEDYSNYNFQWSQTSIGNTNIATGLLNRSYSVTISENTPGCENVTTVRDFTVGNVDGPVITDINTTDATCGQNNGTATLLPANFNYDWGLALGTGNTQNNLVGDTTYSVTVSEPGNACENIIEVTIGEQNDLTATVVINNQPTCGEFNGSATINVADGSGNYTYSWGAEATRDDLSATVSPISVIITDVDTGCSTEVDIILQDDIPGIATVSIDPNTQISCNGANDATLVYNIDYDPDFVEPATVILRDEFGNIENNGNLPAGTWCIVVIDGNGCVAGQNCEDITEPDAIDINYGIVNADCDNPLGAINMTATGGTGTLTYNWADLTGVNNTQNRNDLVPGSYSVTVTDLNGCKVAVGPIVIANDCPTDCETFEVISEVVQDATCGNDNGSIVLNVTGDESDYQYVWTDNISNSHVVDGIGIGIYTVTITLISDPACSIEHTVIIENLDGPEPMIVSISPATCGGSDGGAQLSPANFLYIWKDANGNEFDGANQNNLLSGTYLVTSIDNNTGCQNIITVVIDNINPLTADVVIDNQPDCNINNGAITINVNGGSGNYVFGNTTNLDAGADSTIVIDNVTGCEIMVHYVLENDVPDATIIVDPTLTLPCAGDQDGTVVYTVTYEAGFAGNGTEEIQRAGITVLNGTLTVGDYVILVYDDNNCLAGSAPFTIVAPENIEVTFMSADATCTEGGMINLDIIGGTPPYNVDWNIPGNNNPEDLTDLIAGNYNAIITDANGCTVSVPAITIATSCDPCSTPPVIVGIQTTAADCSVANGFAEITANGAVDDFIYTWPSPINESINSNTASNLNSGSYTVTISNSSDISCFITESFIIDNNQAPDGEIVSNEPATCNAADGEVNLTPVDLIYLWPDTVVSASRNDLVAGTYNVTVSENGNGCTSVIEVVVASISDLVVTHTVDNAPSCGNNDGVVTIVIDNGSGQYIFSPAISNNTMTDLSAGGPYPVSITDIVTGCVTEYEFSLTENIVNAAVNIEADVIVSCIGAADGRVIISPDYNSGFVQPALIKYLQDTVEVTNGNLGVGNYCVEIRDGNNCLAAIECFEVIAPESLTASVSLTNITCEANGSILLNVVGGTTPYSYTWSNDDNTDNPTDLLAGFYTVTITDANGCQTILDDLSIIDECNVCEPPVIANTIITDATCGNSDGSIRIEMEGSGFIFNWNPVNVNNEVINLAGGEVYVTITDASNPTCFITETFIIGNADGPQGTTVVTTDATCENNDGTATLAPANYQYVWGDGNGDTTATRNDLVTGITYVVTVIDPNTNCIGFESVEVGSTNSLTADIVINSLPDCGAADGSVTIVPIGGSGNYEYGTWPSDTRTDLISGPHSLTIRDLTTGCSFLVEFILSDNTQTATINIANDSIDVNCAGDDNGTVVFDVNYDAGFALPADTIITRDGSNVELANGTLTAGNYCIVIRDANDCIAATECFVINEPTVLILDAVLVDINCDLLSSIDLIVEGGTLPYIIDWADTTSNSEDRDSLPAGDYNVTVTDANGCTASLALPIIDKCPPCEDTPIVVNNLTLVDAACGEQNGSAIIDIQGEAADYIFVWFPNVSNGQEAFNLPGGAYSVTITHRTNGDCVIPEPINFVIGNEDGPNAEIVSNIPANCTAADGQVTLSPDTLIYEWSDGGQGAIRTDLSDTTYIITVKDPNSICQNFIEVTVNSVSDLIANSILNAATDCGINNGSATIQIVGGSGNYDYNNNWGTDATRTDLAAGNYPVTITDQATGCQAEVVVEMLDDVPAANITLQLPVLTNCTGSADATANYTITLDPGYHGEPIITIEDVAGNIYTNGNLSAGDYCLIARDSNDCLSEQTCFTVTEPLPITVSVDVTNKSCDSNGSINLIVSNGAGTYLFNWEDLDREEDPQNRVDLAGGFYTVTITDANGCTTVLDDISISDECNNCNVMTTITTNDPGCGLSNGAIQINGLGDYIYEWSNGGTDAELTGLEAGTYRVTVSDVNDPSCFEIEIITLSNPNAPVATITEMDDASCLAANGSVTLEPASLFYGWENADNVSYGTGAAKNNLPAGTYYVTVASGTSQCIDILTIEIEENNPLTVSAAVISEPGCQESNGSVEILVVGGSGDYRYDLDPTNLPAGTYTTNVLDEITGCTESVTFTLENSVVAGANITVDPILLLECAGDENGSALYNITYEPGFITPVSIAFVDGNGDPVNNGSLVPGNYCVTVMNGDSCLAGSACFEVMAPEGMNVAISITNETCNADGTINTAVMGGNPDYTYTWSDTTLTTANRADLASGTYQLTVTDANGCQAIFDNLVVVDECSSNDCDNLIMTNIVTFDSECGLDDGSATITIVGNAADYNFNWSNGETGNSIAGLAGDMYQVTISDPENNTCDTVVNVLIENTNGPDVTIISTSPATCTDNDGTATLSPATYNYSWNLDGVGVAIGENPTDLVAGWYEVVAEDNNGCTQIIMVEIERITTLQASVEILSQSDCGQNNGVARMIITNGSGNYDTQNWGSDAIKNNLASGMYEILITDINTGCEAMVNFTMTDNVPAATVTITNMTQVSCLGSRDATITYDINPGVGFTGTGQAIITDIDGVIYENENLPAGDYCLLVKDDNGCVAGESCFTIESPEALNINLTKKNVDCDQAGAISVDATGGNGNYTFDWADIAGTDNDQNRNNLNAGNYELTVTDDNGCTVTTSVINVHNICITTDTVYVATPFEIPTDTICVDLSEIGSDISRIAICDAPDFGILTPVSDSCLVYTPAESFTGMDTACVIVCNVAGICDTTIIIINVGSPAPCPGEIWNTVDTASIVTSNCVIGGEYCVDLPFVQINNYQILDNGQLYTDATFGCAIDSVVNYSTFTFPSNGNVGPYQLENWRVNGVGFNTEFMTISELVDSMNSWDNSTTWYFDAARSTINGGNPENTYGNMSVRQLITNAFTIVNVNTMLSPTGTSLPLTAGFHELIFTNTITRCTDTLWANVYCVTPEYVTDTINITDSETVCLDISELPGNFVNVENVCNDASGEIVVFDIDQDEVCVVFEGFEVGTEEACMIVCDDLGVCDTTYFTITVIEDFTGVIPPVAVTESDTTSRNNAIDIDGLLNDTINGILDTIIIIAPPANGVVGINEDNTFKYTPNEDYCEPEAPDEFTYAICNQVGCDTTQVFVTVLCDDLVIFTGFSPNGDGVNDYFTIQGIEAFPNNQLLIFNRWGNEVYTKQGYLNDWDGTWNNRKLLPDGTYFYVLEDGQGKRYSGYIQIHR